jgi:hypothetical protein
VLHLGLLLLLLNLGCGYLVKVRCLMLLLMRYSGVIKVEALVQVFGHLKFLGSSRASERRLSGRGMLELLFKR